MRPQVQCAYYFASAILTCASLCAELPQPAPASAPAPANDALTLTATELRAAEQLIEQLAVETDAFKRAQHAASLRQMATADPAKAVFWELWLDGKRIRLAGKKEALEALPRSVRKQSLLIGKYAPDMEALYRWCVENDEDFEDSEEAKLEFMTETESIAQLRFAFAGDGAFKLSAENAKESETGAWTFDTDNGRFTAVLQDKDTQESQYLRGLFQDGNVFLKFPIDLPTISMPVRLKRLDPSPRTALAALLEPMARALELAKLKPLKMPTSIAGQYESEDETMSLTISLEGALSIQFQAADGVKEKPFTSGQATYATESRSEFDCEIDYFAHPSNSLEKNEFSRFVSTFDQRGRQLTQTFKDEKGEVQSVIWIKVK